MQSNQKAKRSAWGLFFDKLFKDSNAKEDNPFPAPTSNPVNPFLITEESRKAREYKHGGGQDFGYPDNDPDNQTETINYLFGEHISLSSQPNYDLYVSVFNEVKKGHKGKLPAVSTSIVLLKEIHELIISTRNTGIVNIKLDKITVLSFSKQMFIAKCAAYLASGCSLLNQAILWSLNNKCFVVVATNSNVQRYLYMTVFTSARKKAPLVVQQSGHLKPWSYDALRTRLEYKAIF